MHKKHIPMKREGSLVFIPDGGFDLRGCPDAENLAALIVSSCNYRDTLLTALEDLIANVFVPDADCSCHISPPCKDCIENSGLRESIENAKSAVAIARAE